MRRTLQLMSLLLLLLLAAAAPAAHATQSALHVSFTPERLGHATSVSFSLNIVAPPGQAPAPLTEINLHYPSDIGLAINGLGLVSCPQSTLELLGTGACPADSHMGQGTATAEIPFGPEFLRESATIAILRAPEEAGHLAVLFEAEAHTPVKVETGFTGLLLPGTTAKNETIHIQIPLLEVLPEGPDVAITQLSATIGPRGLTYYEHIGHHFIPYHPQGVLLPHTCPHKGFPFTASLSFLDGIHTNANTTVPCPQGRATRRPR